MRTLACCLLVGCANAGTVTVPGGTPSLPVETTDEVPTGDTATPTEPTTTVTTDACPPVTEDTRIAVVSDIDETLTTSDNEWLTQIALPNTDPRMRPEADAVMWAYVQKGYRVIYVTSRGEGLRLLDGTTARDATERWLDDHGFPWTSDGVFLADGVGALGGEATDYKTDTLQGLIDAGVTIAFAYGNADTDIAAYINVGIPSDHIFLVGKLAGGLGVEGIPDAEAYGDHLPRVERFVPCAPEP
ncbi:MAG: hypothetical protein KC621_25185 [Myxococcales bacterium]|nr:hypothetical protein [Myxococcales bacterium]